jgi:glycosyltransferase involved in cell wall biosynthesis
VSKGVADDLALLIGLSRDRIDVIYNPVVSDNLLLKAQEPIDHPWFAAGEPPVILSVGRLSPQKDQAMLLRAFAKVRKSIPARLIILGDGDERAALEALARNLHIESDVAVPGFVENPFAYMNKSAVFALSSKYEGLPGVLIQAMACGCPVVSTNCPSGPAEILDGGKYGPLVPVGDEDAMAAALRQKLQEDRTSPPVESLDPFRSEHVMDQIVRVLLD